MQRDLCPPPAPMSKERAVLLRCQYAERAEEARRNAPPPPEPTKEELLASRVHTMDGDYRELTARGLITEGPPWRLTDAGRAELAKEAADG